MMGVIRQLVDDDSGQILPIFALLIVFLMGVTSMAVEGGRVVYLQNKAYNIAEASAISASDSLSLGYEKDEQIKDIAKDYAIENGANDDEVFVTTQYNLPHDNGVGVDSITVRVRMKYKMKFGKAVGIKDRMISEEYTVTKPVTND